MYILFFILINRHPRIMSFYVLELKISILLININCMRDDALSFYLFFQRKVHLQQTRSNHQLRIHLQRHHH